MDNAKSKQQSGLINIFETLAVFPNPDVIDEAVKKLKANHSSKSGPDLARKIVNSATWRLTGIGVVASLPGAIPGLGTAVQFSIAATSITGETWLVLRNLTAMQLMVAGILDYDVSEPERKDELLIVWGIETGAIVPAKEAMKRVGIKVAIEQFDKRVGGAALKRINQKLGTTVLTKWGTKRGGIALGRLIPIGVGTAVGGGMNYLTARGFGTACLKYYCDILPNNEDVFILE